MAWMASRRPPPRLRAHPGLATYGRPQHVRGADGLQTRPEKLEHPDFWARQRARMADPAELRASAQRLGYWRPPPPEPLGTPGLPEPDADRLLATDFLTSGSAARIGAS
jgi:hypothetical protein